MQSLSQWRVALQSGVVVSLVSLCAAASFAQSLGDIARQERERKKEQPPGPTYVYTNDDLKRQHILVPEDRERVVAARRNAASPAVEVSQTPAPSAPVSPATVSALPVSVSTPPPASVSTVAVVPTPAPVETVEAQPEDSARNHTQARLSAPRVISSVPFEDLRSPDTGKKTARAAIVTGLASRSDFSKQRMPRAILVRDPVDSSMAIVTVERGDSLWKLARRYLGKGARWRELAALNVQVQNANVIRVGEWIRLPAPDSQFAQQTMSPHSRTAGSIAPAKALTSSPSTAFTVQIANRQQLALP